MEKIEERRPYTIFMDIDGCLVEHSGNLTSIIKGKPELLPGVLEKFNEWDKKGCKIILTTGRKESAREITERQLSSLGLFWDYLLMGLGGGQRVLINDLKDGSSLPTAIAINVPRNDGLTNVNIEEAIKLGTKQ